MRTTLSCPKCKRQVSSKPLKQWRFRMYDVSHYECQGCKTRFRAYSSPKTTFTIPKAVK